MWSKLSVNDQEVLEDIVINRWDSLKAAFQIILDSGKYQVLTTKSEQVEDLQLRKARFEGMEQVYSYFESLRDKIRTQS